MHRLFCAVLVLVTLAGGALGAPAKSAKPVDAHKSDHDKGSMKQCTGTGKNKSCHKVAVFQGHNAAKTQLRSEPLERPSGNISVRAENLGEEVTVNIYKADGSFDEASLAKLDDIFRCVQTGEVRAVRPELYEMLSRIYDHFEGKQVQLVSGFRFAERDGSRHFHASAMDLRVKDISYRDVYTFATTLDTGHMGLGIYPTGQFIHFDYRAPGEPSYRWTDYSGHGGGGKKKKAPAHTQPARKPVS